VTGYLVAAFMLPFLPPYLASRRSKQDGSWATRYVLWMCEKAHVLIEGRKPLGFTYRPLH
jgi:hypothetical protein